MSVGPREDDLQPERRPPNLPVGRSALGSEEMEERGTAWEAAASYLQGGVDAQPGFTGRLRNRPRSHLGPATIARAVRVCPVQDLILCQRVERFPIPLPAMLGE